MGYEVEFKPSAARDFKKLPGNIQKRITTKIDHLAVEPRPSGAVKLSGEQNFYRIRVGEYRIIYDIKDEKLIVLMVKIGHRKEIYQKILGKNMR